MTDNNHLTLPEDSGYSTTSTPAATLETPKHRNRSTGKRVSHRKSRTGCMTCKGRKVKCDEHRPSCSRCARLHLTCEYPEGASPSREEAPPYKSSPRVHVSDDLDFLHLELLHTYTTFTCSTLAWPRALRDFWKVTVPTIALKHTYLMRTLLALPALHLAYLRPESRCLYVSAALENHRIGSEAARNRLESVSDEEGVSLFLFSALSLVIVLATPQRSFDGVILDDHASFNDLLVILKGLKGLMCTTWGGLSGSPLAPLLSCGTERFTLQENFSQIEQDYHPATELLDDLQDLLNYRVSDVETLTTYTKVIQMLRDATACVHLWEGSDALIWIYRSLEDFIPVLEWQTPEALVVLAHFAVLLKKCETQWWLQGWAVHIISTVYHQLNDEHKIWIYGPAQEIGWVFPQC